LGLKKKGPVADLKSKVVLAVSSEALLGAEHGPAGQRRRVAATGKLNLKGPGVNVVLLKIAEKMAILTRISVRYLGRRNYYRQGFLIKTPILCRESPKMVISINPWSQFLSSRFFIIDM
jgi:hypothetical protein